MTHYLVDYENVFDEGLEGLSSLTGPSVIHIFFSKNANRINMESLVCSENIRLHFIEINPGKQGSQELDKHLVSYLGYLIGKAQADNIPNENYIVVSKDRGYTNTIEFWNKKMQQPNLIKQTINIAGESLLLEFNDIKNELNDIINKSGENFLSNSVDMMIIIKLLLQSHIKVDDIKYIGALLNSDVPNDIENIKTYIHGKLFSKFGITGRDYYLIIKPFLK